MKHDPPRTLLTEFKGIDLSYPNTYAFLLSSQHIFTPPPTSVRKKTDSLLKIMHLPYVESIDESIDESSFFEIISFFGGLFPPNNQSSLIIDSFNDPSSSDKLLRIVLSYEETNFIFLLGMPLPFINSFNQKSSSSQESPSNQFDHLFYNSIKKFESLLKEIILPSDISSLTYQSFSKMTLSFSKPLEEIESFLGTCFYCLNTLSFIITLPSNSYFSGFRFLSGESFFGLHLPSNQYLSRMTPLHTEHPLRNAITLFSNFIDSVNKGIILKEQNSFIISRSMSQEIILNTFFHSLCLLSKHPNSSENDSFFLNKLKRLFFYHIS
jgi:hypothetical protein